MRKFMTTATVLLIACLAVPAIAADNNANTKISIGFYFDATSKGGIFSILGAGDPHGTADVTSRLVTVNPDGSQKITLTKTLHFSDGSTIFLKTEGSLVGSAATTPFIESVGTWVITDGDGLYVNAAGSGTYHWCRTVATGNLAGAYSGKIKIDSRDDD
jgi:hypothetical protein